MLAFPSMLENPAIQAGMSVPLNSDDFDKNKEKYPHFFVFCLMQLGRSMPRPSSHWDNAKIIAEIPIEKISSITIGEILDLGFE